MIDQKIYRIVNGKLVPKDKETDAMKEDAGSKHFRLPHEKVKKVKIGGKWHEAEEVILVERYSGGETVGVLRRNNTIHIGNWSQQDDKKIESGILVEISEEEAEFIRQDHYELVNTPTFYVPKTRSKELMGVGSFLYRTEDIELVVRFPDGDQVSVLTSDGDRAIGDWDYIIDSDKVKNGDLLRISPKEAEEIKASLKEKEPQCYIASESGDPSKVLIDHSVMGLISLGDILYISRRGDHSCIVTDKHEELMTDWTEEMEELVESGDLEKTDILAEVSEDDLEDWHSIEFTSEAEATVFGMFYHNGGSELEECDRCGKRVGDIVPLSNHKICRDCQNDWENNWKFDGNFGDGYVNFFIEKSTQFE
jgi:hypothetical protein